MELKITERLTESGKPWYTHWAAPTKENGAEIEYREVAPGTYALPAKCGTVTMFKKDNSVVLEISVPLVERVGDVSYLTVGKTILAPERALKLLGPDVLEELLSIRRGTRVPLVGEGEIGWQWEPRKGPELYFSRVALSGPVSLRNYAQVGGIFQEETLYAVDTKVLDRLKPAPAAQPLPTLPTLTPKAAAKAPALQVPDAPTPAALEHV